MKPTIYTFQVSTKYRADRARKAWFLRQQGLSYEAIGRAIGCAYNPSKPLSSASVKHLIWEWKVRLKRPPGIPAVMSTRAYKILQIEAIKAGEPISRQFGRRLIESGALDQVENCGMMTLEEIRRWAYMSQ